MFSKFLLSLAFTTAALGAHAAPIFATYDPYDRTTDTVITGSVDGIGFTAELYGVPSGPKFFGTGLANFYSSSFDIAPSSGLVQAMQYVLGQDLIIKFDSPVSNLRIYMRDMFINSSPEDEAAVIFSFTNDEPVGVRFRDIDGFVDADFFSDTALAVNDDTANVAVGTLRFIDTFDEFRFFQQISTADGLPSPDPNVFSFTMAIDAPDVVEPGPGVVPLPAGGFLLLGGLGALGTVRRKRSTS